MIPVLFKFTFDSPLGQVIAYLLAVAIILYGAFAGWRGAVGKPVPGDKDKGQGGEAAFGPPTRADQVTRALMGAAFGGVLAKIGLHYALPAGKFLGGKGEGLPLHTYGIMLAGGFICAVTVVARLMQHEWGRPVDLKLSPKERSELSPGALAEAMVKAGREEGLRKRDQMLDLSFWILASAIVGSKVLFMMVNWKDYRGHWGEYLSNPGKLLDLLGGGLVFYGGLIGAILMSLWYARKHGIDFVRLADLAIPTVSLGQAIGRLGCFAAGCCWGDVAGAGVRWGVHFPGSGIAKDIFGRLSHTASLSFQSQATDSRWVLESTGQVFHQPVPGAVQISKFAADHGYTMPVHPTQLYESLGQLFLFVFFLWMRRYRRFHGQIFGMWLMSYAILRSTVELFRGDTERGTLHGLLSSLGLTSLADKVPLEAWYNISTSQFISLCMFSLGATLLYQRGRKVWARNAAHATPVSA